MKSLQYYFLTALLASGLFLSAQSPWRSNEMQVKVFAKSSESLEYLHQAGINADYAGDFLRCYLTPEELKGISERGINYEIEIADLNQWSLSFGSRGVPSGYYTVDELDDIADSLAANFPDICVKVPLGLASNSDMIYALKISDNPETDENEPGVLFDGGIHGDEVGGSENMIRFARDLCLNYNTDTYITGLVDNTEIWIIYCLNPYGRRNMSRYNQPGVDINRDSGFMWNGEGNSPSAFSQPETKILRDILINHPMVIHCSYHSGIEFISFPWSYREAQTPDHAQHLYLSSVYADVSGYTNIPNQQGYSGMYPINGSTKDNGYGAMGTISWSVEISVSKQPPASQIVPIYLKNKPSMLAMCEYAAFGISGNITDAVTGAPVAATVFVNNLYPVYNKPLTGGFHKFLTAGTYSLKVVANGYEPQLINGVVVNDLQSTIVDVQMQPATGHYAKSIISSYIPNNNPSDEGFTPAALGPPDAIQYSIGRFGWAVFDMGTPVVNGEGDDVIVHENDATPEGYNLYASGSPDGPWRMLGAGNGTKAFDLAGTLFAEARYFKITDDGDGQSQVANAGFDLDAIEGIVRVPPVDSTGWISGVVYCSSPLICVDPVADALITCGEFETISDEYGQFTIRADTGRVTVCGDKPGFNVYGLYGCTEDVMVTPGDTTTADLYLDFLESAGYKKSVQLLVYPNPAGEWVRISVENGSGIKNAAITNLSGSELNIEIQKVNEFEVLIRTAHFLPGIYTIKAELNDGSFVFRKFIIR